MQISFNGVLAVATYNCVMAHKLRNIDKKFPPKIEETNLPQAEKSKRQQGIENHDLTGKYLKGEIDALPFKSDVIEQIKDLGQLHKIFIEEPEYFDTDFNPLSKRPDNRNENFIYCRKDAVLQSPGVRSIFDWKFGSSDFGSVRYYDEIEFFVSLDAAANPDIGEWIAEVHFPTENYSLPIRTYDLRDVARLQTKYKKRIDRLLKTTIFVPNPGKFRCRLCDQRSEDTGGTGACEVSII